MPSNLQKMLTIKQLRLVSVLGRELNLSRSAELLHTTQPAASRALTQLESLLQVSLFSRTTKRIIPTAAGLNLLQHARRVLAEIDLAEEELNGLKGGIVAELRVGHLAVFSPGVLALAMIQSREMLPDVLLITELLSLETLYEQLLEGRIDLMLAHAELRVDLNLVEVIPLYEEHGAILAGVAHRLLKKKKVSWSDLAQQAWVLPPTDTPLRPKMDRMLSVYRTGGHRERGPDVQTDSLLLALQLLEQSDMLWAIAYQQARQFEMSSQVRIIQPPMDLLRGPMCAFRLRQESLQTHQRLFISWLKESAQALTC